MFITMPPGRSCRSAARPAPAISVTTNSAPGGRLISSRVVNRTGTFVFYIGDHFFGTITAHVAGEDAADYKFTSALSAQMLKALAPILNPLINGAPVAEEIATPPIAPTQPLPP